MAAQTFLYRHRLLHMLWSEELKRPFLTLTLRQQRLLHDYYRPSEDLTDPELLLHKATITGEFSQLAAQAGKAFRRIERVYLVAMDVADGDPAVFERLMHQGAARTASSSSEKGQRLMVSSLARPEIDVEQLARVLLDVAKQVIADETADKAESGPQGEAA